jgi:hypothetical protein
LLAKFGVIIGDFTRQLFKHGLPADAVEAAGQFGHRLGDGGQYFIRIDRFRLVHGDRIFGEKAVDGFDDQAVQARPFFVLVLFVGDGRNSDGTFYIGAFGCDAIGPRAVDQPLSSSPASLA